MTLEHFEVLKVPLEDINIFQLKEKAKKNVYKAGWIEKRISNHVRGKQGKLLIEMVKYPYKKMNFAIKYASNKRSSKGLFTSRQINESELMDIFDFQDIERKKDILKKIL